MVPFCPFLKCLRELKWILGKALQDSANLVLEDDTLIKITKIVTANATSQWTTSECHTQCKILSTHSLNPFIPPSLPSFLPSLFFHSFKIEWISCFLGCQLHSFSSCVCHLWSSNCHPQFLLFIFGNSRLVSSVNKNPWELNKTFENKFINVLLFLELPINLYRTSIPLLI